MEDIVKKLEENIEEKYKEFHSRLCPGINNIMGVRIPILRQIAKDIAKKDYKEFLKKVNTKYYETVMIYGLVIGYAKIDLENRLKYLDKFVPKIDNWAICDCCTSTYKFTQNNLEELWKYVQKYLKSDKEFEIRFGIIMLMDYYLIPEYFDKVLEIYDNIQHDGYYVKMAIAWAISIAFIKDEKKTREYLNNNKLDDFTYNKALQKIIESNRVSKGTKDEIRKMKRKTSNKK